MSGDENVPEIFERVIKAFQKHEQISKESTRLEIAESLKEFKHFKALTRQDNCLDYFYAAIPLLKYQRIRKRDFVFHHSDRGGVFYFILKGRAGVLVPKSPEVVAKEVELNAIIINCVDRITKTTIPEEKAMLEADKAIALKQLTAMRDPYSEDLMSKQKIRYFKDDGRVCLFRYVNTLKSTDSFGEVSIVSSKKLRTASVISEDEELHVLSITGENYIAVFDQELSRLNFTLHVLEETFTNSSRDSIVRLAYEFKEMVLDKNQIIFKEGQPAKQVFLVKSGEIEITKDIKKPQVASFFNIKGNTQTKVTKTPNKFVRKFELKSQIIAILGAEAFFGLEEQPFHQFSARSGSNNSVVFGIDRSLLENYNVLKLLQKRSAMKNQFYSARFDKLMEFEEQQDVQRAQPRRPDYQSLLNAGRIAHPELVDQQEKEDIRRQSVLINLNNNTLRENSISEKSHINNEKQKKNNNDKTINSEESKSQKLIKNTDNSMNHREQSQGSFSGNNQESQPKNNKDHTKLESNRMTTSLPDFQGLPETEKSIGSEQIFQTQILFPTNGYPSSTCETLRQYPLETIRLGLEDQSGEAQQQHIQITEGHTEDEEEEEELKRKIISEESESELIKDQGFKRQEEQEKQYEGDQLHQQKQEQHPSQLEQHSQQLLGSSKHKRLKFRWSNILSETKSIPQNQYHHKATSLSLNTIYHKGFQDDGSGHKKKENSICISSNEETKHKNIKPLSSSQIIVNPNQLFLGNDDEIANNQPNTADNNTRPRMNSWNEMSSIEHHVKYANEKTAQNVSSLHSFSNKNNHKNLLNNTTNILADSVIQENNGQPGIISPHKLLHFGEGKTNSKPTPKLQFKLVIQDLLEKKNMGETFNYFRKGKDAKIGAMWSTDEEKTTDLQESIPERHLSTKDISRYEKIKKKSNGLEGQIETLSVKERISQTLSYNQTVLEQKKIEQLARLQDSMEQERVEYLKLQKHAVIRQSKRRHDDFLQGIAESQRQCNQVMLKLNQGQEEDPLSQLVCLPKQFQQQQQQQLRRNTTNQAILNQQSQLATQSQTQSNLQISIRSLPHLFQSATRSKISANSPKSTFPTLNNKENHRNSNISSKAVAVIDTRRQSDCQEQQTQPFASQPATFAQQIQNIHQEYQIDNQLGHRYVNNSPNNDNVRSNSKKNSQIVAANYYFVSNSKQQQYPQIDYRNTSASLDQNNNKNSFDVGFTENPESSQQNQEKSSIKTAFSQEQNTPTLISSNNNEATAVTPKSQQVDNSKNEIAQLQLFAQMHLNKSTRMQFYKSKPNFHLLDQKKIKNTSSSKEREQPGKMNTSIIPSLQHSSLFPVIHSFNNVNYAKLN